MLSDSISKPVDILFLILCNAWTRSHLESANPPQAPVFGEISIIMSLPLIPCLENRTLELYFGFLVCTLVSEQPTQTALVRIKKAPVERIVRIHWVDFHIQPTDCME
jgi:hypothetical protein